MNDHQRFDDNGDDQSNGYEDALLTCISCRVEFLHSARDQAFFASQNPPFTPPRRCKPCRAENKARREAGRGTQGWTN